MRPECPPRWQGWLRTLKKTFKIFPFFSLEHLTTIPPSPGSETLRTLARVVVECWHHSPPVRLTALRVKKTLARWTQITLTLYFVLWTFISSVSLSGYLASRLKNMKLFLIVSILQTWMRYQSPSSSWQHEQVWACQCQLRPTWLLYLWSWNCC